ncbi:probable carboxylesterase 17 [Actinidia eriantha]|uniref:probable carboxylesterase 17 n=1 Tax=Actinidia eriantha TaxID=165200 RepID=UPI00258B733E|nr:probable carboxylesterase 17 [Actinidia eriantha]
MASISLDPRLNLQTGKTHHQNSALVEEIEGIIRVYKDGSVERHLILPNVSCAVNSELSVTSKDVVIDKFTSLWARLYVPSHQYGKLPLLVYFHGGGFCVGSTSWSCYHNFLSNLASIAGCVIVSVNYRLAPENRLPAAYEDGFKAVMWVKQQALNGSDEEKWWVNRCSFSSVFLAGDSAGANIAHNVATRLGSNGTSDPSILKPLCLKGTILIQPFFGGETRTESERQAVQPPGSALTLPSSDTYWQLSLPVGANRDHHWCNPLAKGSTKVGDCGLPPMMVCISEMDILKDRNLEFCAAMASAGKRVEKVIYRGVGHAFQILHKSHLSQLRTHEMMSHLKAFIHH